MPCWEVSLADYSRISEQKRYSRMSEQKCHEYQPVYKCRKWECDLSVNSVALLYMVCLRPEMAHFLISLPFCPEYLCCILFWLPMIGAPFRVQIFFPLFFFFFGGRCKGRGSTLCKSHSWKSQLYCLYQILYQTWQVFKLGAIPTDGGLPIEVFYWASSEVSSTFNLTALDSAPLCTAGPPLPPSDTCHLPACLWRRLSLSPWPFVPKA